MKDAEPRRVQRASAEVPMRIHLNIRGTLILVGLLALNVALHLAPVTRNRPGRSLRGS